MGLFSSSRATSTSTTENNQRQISQQASGGSTIIQEAEDVNIETLDDDVVQDSLIFGDRTAARLEDVANNALKTNEIIFGEAKDLAIASGQLVEDGTEAALDFAEANSLAAFDTNERITLEALNNLAVSNQDAFSLSRSLTDIQASFSKDALDQALNFGEDVNNALSSGLESALDRVSDLYEESLLFSDNAQNRSLDAVSETSARAFQSSNAAVQAAVETAKESQRGEGENVLLQFNKTLTTGLIAAGAVVAAVFIFGRR